MSIQLIPPLGWIQKHNPVEEVSFPNVEMKIFYFPKTWEFKVLVQKMIIQSSGFIYICMGQKAALMCMKHTLMLRENVLRFYFPSFGNKTAKIRKQIKFNRKTRFWKWTLAILPPFSICFKMIALRSQAHNILLHKPKKIYHLHYTIASRKVVHDKITSSFFPIVLLSPFPLDNISSFPDKNI